MLLVVDVGNSNIVLGIYDGVKLLYNWRISTERSRTSDEYGILVNQLFQYQNIDPLDISDMVISSVVPTLMHTLSNMSIKYFGIKPIIIGPGVKTGMNIKYDNPKEVGADRIVNAVAGFETYGGPLIVVDSGTAITFDAISKDGEYLGGAITPGIQISSEALFMRTAKLPKVEISKPKNVIGRNTINSIQSGLVYGYIGMVDYIIERIMNEMGTENGKVNVVATGGFSNLIASESKHIKTIDKLLTLDGLRIIYERNK